ncbi:MAG TPA: dethiobiotin synthase, partial [Dermatophilaceae bacterium]|nr:dethiobiotin synthase [Dermatophilaceae bacterium]
MAEPMSLPAVVVVTGTSTGVGKTVATAALTVMVRRRGVRVAVVKPAQTGVLPGEPGDIDEVCRLVGDDAEVTYREFVRLPDPIAPSAAARRIGVTLDPI